MYEDIELKALLKKAIKSELGKFLWRWFRRREGEEVEGEAEPVQSPAQVRFERKELHSLAVKARKALGEVFSSLHLLHPNRNDVFFDVKSPTYRECVEQLWELCIDMKDRLEDIVSVLGRGALGLELEKQGRLRKQIIEQAKSMHQRALDFKDKVANFLQSWEELRQSLEGNLDKFSGDEREQLGFALEKLKTQVPTFKEQAQKLLGLIERVLLRYLPPSQEESE